jgi:hypothetical protein
MSDGTPAWVEDLYIKALGEAHDAFVSACRHRDRPAAKKARGDFRLICREIDAAMDLDLDNLRASKK